MCVCVCVFGVGVQTPGQNSFKLCRMIEGPLGISMVGLKSEKTAAHANYRQKRVFHSHAQTGHSQCMEQPIREAIVQAQSSLS